MGYTAKCRERAECTGCYASVHGGCDALTDNGFGRKRCPFRKTRAVRLENKIAAAERLIKMDRFDAITLYYGSFANFAAILERDKEEIRQ